MRNSQPALTVYHHVPCGTWFPSGRGCALSACSTGRLESCCRLHHLGLSSCFCLASCAYSFLTIEHKTHMQEQKLRSRQWPVGRAAATHRLQRRPDRPPPIRNDRRHPGTQMRRPRAGARRYTRALPVRSGTMWSLPISPPTAYVLLINSLRRVERDCWQLLALLRRGCGHDNVILRSGCTIDLSTSDACRVVPDFRVVRNILNQYRIPIQNRGACQKKFARSPAAAAPVRVGVSLNLPARRDTARA